jgi:hypothetical protein
MLLVMMSWVSWIFCNVWDMCAYDKLLVQSRAVGCAVPVATATSTLNYSRTLPQPAQRFSIHSHLVSYWIFIAVHHHRKSACAILSRKLSNACTFKHSKTPMQDSSRNDPRFSLGVSNINANGAILNQVGRDQYNHYQHYSNYNNAMNDEMVVCQSHQ